MVSKIPANPHVENLVAKAQHGDIRAFAKLYDLYVIRIYRFVYVRIRNREDAQDITSEVWKTVWVNFKKYTRGNFQGYLFRIAYTTLIGYIREEQRRKEVSIDNFPNIKSPKRSPEDDFITKEQVRKVYKILNKLPKHYATVIILRLIEGFSIRETARIVGKPSVLVRVTQHRALKKLQQILKEV